MKTAIMIFCCAAFLAVAFGQETRHSERRIKRIQERQQLTKDAPELVDSEKATATELDMIKKLYELIKIQATQIADLEARVKKLEGVRL